MASVRLMKSLIFMGINHFMFNIAIFVLILAQKMEDRMLYSKMWPSGRCFVNRMIRATPLASGTSIHFKICLKFGGCALILIVTLSIGIIPLGSQYAVRIGSTIGSNYRCHVVHMALLGLTHQTLALRVANCDVFALNYSFTSESQCCPQTSCYTHWTFLKDFITD
jgi:hypothetical protein